MSRHKSGEVIKKILPGKPGTIRWLRQFGAHLVCVRYRGNATRRVRTTTVEIVVDEKFWMPHPRTLYPVIDSPVNT